MAARRRASDASQAAKVGHPREVAPAILLLASLLRRSANITYKRKLGLSAIAWTMIARLGSDGPMTQNEIAEKYLIDKGQLSRTAAGLARRSLITRERKTWRSIELKLAPKGQLVYAAIKRISQARHQLLTRGIKKSDVKILLQSVEIISERASRMLDDVGVKLEQQP